MKLLKYPVRIKNEFFLLIIIIFLMCVMAFLSEKFLTLYNILEVTRYFVETGLISFGMTLIMVSGGIDLSVGSILGLCDVLCGFMWSSVGINIWISALIAVLSGGLMGLFNGVFVSFLGMQPLTVTLASMAIYRGIALGITSGNSVSNFPENFLFLGQGYISGIPFQLFVFIFFLIFAIIFLHKHYVGKYIYSIGLNETASIYSGVPVKKIKLIVYTITGVLCGIAGVIFVSRTGTAKADAGLGVELEVITAVVLGGTNITGGKGRITGTLLGILIITLTRNGMLLARFPVELQSIIIGLILILSAFITGRKIVFEKGK